MTTGIVRDQNLEKQIHKQMGCMSGFLQIFDRHQILTGKRIHSAKRLPPSVPPASDSSPEPEKNSGSPAASTPSPESVKQSPAREAQSPAPAKVVLPLPGLEFKEGTRSSWKFSREAPRLSLDSRAVVDAKGTLHPREIPTNARTTESEGDKQRRSTSVIVRLMGLEPLPDSNPDSVKKAELRRSSSESRVSRDLPQYRFFDTTNNFQLKQLQQKSQGIVVRENNVTIDNVLSNGRVTEFGVRNGKAEGAKASSLRHKGIMGQKKSFYDSADFFPEPKHTVSVYGEIERRLKMRGIDEPSRDLETLKHILEALQLKGLLHSNNATLPTKDSPIVLMKPATRCSRSGNDSPPPSTLRARRSLSLVHESRRSDRVEVDRNIRGQGRSRNSSPNRRKVNDGGDSRRVSPVNSPRRRNVAGQQMTTGGSPRMRKTMMEHIHKEKVLGVAEDESSTLSETSFSASSRTDTERYKEGRNLLDRCDKLLNSIAEITATTDLQPSPVSVLDSSFYRDDCSSPSPITKRCIDYKDQAGESEDEMWSAVLCSSEAKSEEASWEDCDFVYASEVLRACSYLPEDSDIFLLLEKQQYLKGKDTSKASKLQRRLIFDTIHEILNRTQQLPPWKAVSFGEQMQRIWSEFRRIREREESDDLFEVICGVLRKDMAEEMSGWGEWPMEMGDVVLDLERLVFKDLIGETIQELASFGAKCNTLSALRRKLMF